MPSTLSQPTSSLIVLRYLLNNNNRYASIPWRHTHTMKMAVCVLFVVCMVLVVDRAYIHHLLTAQKYELIYVRDIALEDVKERVTTNEKFVEIYRKRIFK